MQASLSRGAVVTKDGPQAPTRQAIRMVGDPSNKPMASTPVSGREGVLVGDIVLNLGNRNKPIAQAESQQQPPKSSDVPAVIVKESESNIFMRNYRSKSDDVQWAKNGLVATVINGEAIPVVQNRITDAGFKDLVVTPMGADKVFICRPEGGGYYGCCWRRGEVLQTRLFELGALGQGLEALSTGRVGSPVRCSALCM
jgi:hypothetical protein